MEQALRQGNEKLNADLERERHSKQQLETQLARLVHAIAEGRPCQCFMEESGDRERELKAITSELLEPGRDSLRATPDELRDFAISQLAKIRGLISHPESVDLARAVLAERGAHLEPTIQSGEPVYLAQGKVDFSEKWRWREWVVPGARIACNSHKIPFRFELAAA